MPLQPRRLAALPLLLSVALAADPPASQQPPPVPPAHPVRAGPLASQALVEEVTALDRRLFEAVFDTCDADAVAALLDDSFEFVHDKHGLTASTPARFVEQIRDSCRGRSAGTNVTARRELVPGSLEVHAVEGFGAIQMAVHRFLGLEPGRPPVLRETGRLFHVWRRGADGQLRLHRAYSFDHRAAAP